MEVSLEMFCETCGTVLDVHGQCINCDKRQFEREIEAERQVDFRTEIAR